jgi:hypothetical protein
MTENELIVSTMIIKILKDEFRTLQSCWSKLFQLVSRLRTLKIIIAEEKALPIEKKPSVPTHRSFYTMCEIVQDSELEELYKQERYLTTEGESVDFLRALLSCSKIETVDPLRPSLYSYEKALALINSKAQSYPNLALPLFVTFMGEYLLNKIVSWTESIKMIEQALAVGCTVLLVFFFPHTRQSTKLKCLTRASSISSIYSTRS